MRPQGRQADVPPERPGVAMSIAVQRVMPIAPAWFVGQRLWSRLVTLGLKLLRGCPACGNRPGGTARGQRLHSTAGRGHQRRAIWAVSSAGRAPALQAGGHWFEPSTAHRREPLLTDVWRGSRFRERFALVAPCGSILEALEAAECFHGAFSARRRGRGLSSGRCPARDSSAASRSTSCRPGRGFSACRSSFAATMVGRLAG